MYSHSSSIYNTQQIKEEYDRTNNNLSRHQSLLDILSIPIKRISYESNYTLSNAGFANKRLDSCDTTVNIMQSTYQKQISPMHSPFSLKSVAEMTPPLTPAVSSEDLTSNELVSQQHFPKYLRAIYPFHPPCDIDSDTVTLPLNQGDVILVHSVHSNGWADGTLLDTAHRGWLPTNYCEEFASEPVRALLNSLTTFWDSANEEADGTVAMIHGHNLTQGLVAGVRYLLAGTDCLNRDCENLTRTSGHSALRRHRKTLLSDLADLVKFFKICQISANEGYIAEDDLSQLVLQTFKIIVRAIRFHDVWTQDLTKENNKSTPPTPPLETSSFCSEQSNSDLLENRHVASQAAAVTGIINLTEPQPQHKVRNSDSCPRSSVQSSKHVYHRISWSVAGQRNGRLASSRLISAQDGFLSHLGGFLSIHLITQTSTEVLIATQQAVNSGRSLLTVVEAVWDRGLCKSKLLEQTRDDMYTKITQLVHAAQQIFASPDNEDSEPTTRKELSDAALSCITCATDCVNATKAALELIGDFEFETINESFSTGMDFEADDAEYSRDSTDYTLVQDFPMPPECSSQTSLSEDHQITPTHHATRFITSPEESPATTPSSRLSVSSFLQPPPSLTDASSVGDVSPLSVDSDYMVSYPLRNQSLDMKQRLESPPLSASSRTMSNESWSISALNHSDSATNLTDSGSSVGPYALDRDLEDDIMQTTYAHELIFNKDGQISGGTLPALVERLTTSDSRPDHIFMSSFFLTFRLFTTPEAFAEALVHRYQYIAEYKSSAPVVRLRVYNVFKTWIESNWRKDTDTVALSIVQKFAENDLVFAHPSASGRLLDLINNLSGEKVPGSLKSKASLEQLAKSTLPVHTPVPASAMSKHQVTLLKTWQQGACKPLITHFDPLEIARQLTLKASALFCAIQPEELLNTEWTKKSGSYATNVRAMSTLSTDLTNLVAETVLQFDEHSKRAKVIKHWIKVATKCLELNNYDSLMAIVCSLNSTPILRLKKTWDCVSTKAKAAFENFRVIVECSKNYTNLRQRLATLVTPTLPFLGVYLTDLTFVEAGNSCTRNLPDNSATAINFDKHAKTAKIIFELQRFQVPYQLHEIPEFQAWLQDQFVQVRFSLDNGSSPITKLYRRSCILEPRPSVPTKPATSSTRIPQLNKSPFLGTYFN